MKSYIESLFTNNDWSVRSVVRLVGFALVVLLLVSAALTIVKHAFFGGDEYSQGREYDTYTLQYGRDGDMTYKTEGGMGGGMMSGMTDVFTSAPMMDMMNSKMGMMQIMPEMSATSIIMPPMQMVNGGKNAEKYEHTGYSAQYETKHLTELCEEIEGLKPLEYVIFDSMNQGDQYCSYAFRAENDRADEIVAKLKSWDPEHWNVNVYTVAQSIENSQDTTESLERRLELIESTLAEADRSYNKLIALATDSNKVGDLTSIINSKLSMIERLSNEKLSLQEQIKNMTGGVDDQLDDVAYTHFDVSVSKIVLVDWDRMGEQWRALISQTVADLNYTLGLILFSIPVMMLNIVFYGLMITIGVLSLVYLGRFLWSAAVMIWTKK
jgi:hypothetical protein